MEHPAKARLLILASTYPRWAGDHEPSFVHELARRLTDRFDVVAVVPHAKGALDNELLDGVRVVRYRYAPEALETLVNNGGIVTNLQRSRWKILLVPGFVAMQWVVARRHVSNNAVVHAHWIVPQGLVARLLRKPFLITSHGADLFALRGRIAMAAKRFSIRKSGCLAVVSEAMREPARELIPRDNVAVRPMGVDMRDLFKPDPAVVRDDKHLLFVGRLVEKKGLDVLLLALPKVLEAHPEVRLTVVGHGPLESAMVDLAARIGVADHVTFMGPVPQRDLPALYRRASLFVAPFREARSGDREGLGLVLVEALACGCPVVASDIPSTRDVLYGFPGVRTVSPGDPQPLADAIIDASEGEHRLSSEVVGARDRLSERFDWDAVAEGYADLLDSVRTGGRVADPSR